MTARSFLLASYAVALVMIIAIFSLALVVRDLAGPIVEFCFVAGCGMLFSSWLRYADLRVRALRRREESELRAWVTLNCGHSIEILHRVALRTSPGDPAECPWCEIDGAGRRVERVRWATESPSLGDEEEAA